MLFVETLCLMLYYSPTCNSAKSNDMESCEHRMSNLYAPCETLYNLVQLCSNKIFNVKEQVITSNKQPLPTDRLSPPIYQPHAGL